MTFFDEIRASKAVGSKNYDVAIEIYKKRLEADERDSFALSMLAYCYKWKGDREAALEYVNKRPAQDPKDFYMLLLAARCWSEKDNEDQTYNYACRAIENVPRAEPEDIPKLIYFMLKPLSIFTRFRRLASKVKESDFKFKKHYRESIEWAWQYKQWYETKHSNM
jgi:tetratricopeptide (TPR) repeat protein